MNQWIVSLSDGQRLSEVSLIERIQKNNLSISPWLWVLDFLKSNPEKNITHIELIVKSQRYNSPSLGKDTKFKNSINPEKLWVCRKWSQIIGKRGTDEEYLSFSYRIGNSRHFTWVNVKTNEMYTEIRDINNSLESDIDNEYSQIEQSKIKAGVQ